MLDSRKLLFAFAAGAGAALLLCAAVGAAITEFGLFDVAASTSHTWLARLLTHRTMIASVRRQSDVDHINISDAAVKHGLCSYEVHCTACHGSPGTARAPWANGLNPTPPYLIDARERWTPSELHWIVSNGIKMTAMPAWKASLPDQQVWELVAAVELLPRLKPATYKSWVASNCGE